MEASETEKDPKKRKKNQYVEENQDIVGIILERDRDENQKAEKQE